MLIPFKDIVRKYGKPKGILHIGANVGEEAKAYNDEGIKNVCWVEANPELVPILRRNVESYKHAVIEMCVGDEDDKEVTFHISNNAGQSSSVLELGTHKQVHPEVHYTHNLTLKTKRIDTQRCFNPANYDFVNIDLQGAELMALRGMGDFLKNYKYAYIEVNKNHLYVDCPLIGDIDSYLNVLGFKRVETKWCGNFGWGDALYIKL
jgi:FkbM family methyltransferase